MAKLSQEEADQLAALRAKEEAPDDEPDDEPGGDDGHVIVLRGSRADTFLSELLGTKTKTPPAKKAAPAKPKTARDAARPPAKTESDADAGTDGDDDDQGDGDQGDQDAPPPKANRYFR